ncbi:hypothetical protein GCM10009530_52330 [Microbispora corallina]|uniref:Uncharacterized protein n=2 Tax=Microbispora corallina TaxID=83302 RepID=A0ABQ4G2U9_9ACTN|nr:hypothetical protein Mco01_44080 [Microbispora corallina]
MLISAGVVGAVLIGGISVTATAFAGRLEQAPGAGSDPAGAGRVAPATPGPVDVTGRVTPPPDNPDVVSSELTGDPGDVADYWTDERLEDAQPMPMPQVSISIITPGD